MKYLPLLFVLACGFAQGPPIQDAVVNGEIDRDGEVVPLVGYTSDGGSAPLPLTFGFVHSTSDGPVVVQMSLTVENLGGQLPMGGGEVPVLDYSNASGTWPHIGLSYWEEAANHEDGEYLYRAVYRQSGTVNGTLYADDTNWSDYFKGRLEVTLFEANYGERNIDIDIDWEAEAGLADL